MGARAIVRRKPSARAEPFAFAGRSNDLEIVLLPPDAAERAMRTSEPAGAAHITRGGTSGPGGARQWLGAGPCSSAPHQEHDGDDGGDDRH